MKTTYEFTKKADIQACKELARTMIKSSTNIPSRYWEPEDDRTEEELIQIYESEEHQEIEIPFE